MTNVYKCRLIELSLPSTRHGEASTNKSLCGKLTRSSGSLSSNHNASSWAPTRKSPSGPQRRRINNATKGLLQSLPPRHGPSRNNKPMRREMPKMHKTRRRQEEGNPKNQPRLNGTGGKGNKMSRWERMSGRR